MTFKKDHKQGARKLIERVLDKDPISFKGYEGSRADLKLIPGWQGMMRDYVEQLIEKNRQIGRDG